MPRTFMPMGVPQVHGVLRATFASLSIDSGEAIARLSLSKAHRSSSRGQQNGGIATLRGVYPERGRRACPELSRRAQAFGLSGRSQ
jgi:hypothetical protein